MQTQSRIARLRHIHTHLYAKQYLINLEAETNSIVHTLLYNYLALSLLFGTIVCAALDVFRYHSEITIQSSSVLLMATIPLSVPNSYLEVMDVNLHSLSFYIPKQIKQLETYKLTACSIQTEYLHHKQARNTHKLSPQAKLTLKLGWICCV